MNRTTVALLAALEALIAVAVGVGIVLVPLTVLWAAQFGMAVDWAVFWRAGADVWLAGHGVDLTVSLPATTAATLGLPAASAPFPITIAVLGFAMLTGAFGVRAGLRSTLTPAWRLGAIVAVVVFAALYAVVTLTAGSAAVAPSAWQGILLPPFVFALGLAIGIPAGLAHRNPGNTSGTADAPARGLRARYARLDAGTRDGVAAALRAGTGAVALLMAAAAVLTALLIVLNFGTIVGLYESLHAGALGGSVLTLGQLALLPNLVIWTLSWLAGPGFALGTGSSVGPMGTQLGPIPSLPLFGVLPHGTLFFGFLGLAVPLLAGFAAALLVRRGDPRHLHAPRSLAWKASVAGGMGAVAGVIAGLLAWWSGGAVGPGRLLNIGPNPWLVALFVALEVAVGGIVGLLARRPDASR
jgi:hypothetical protein